MKKILLCFFFCLVIGLVSLLLVLHLIAQSEHVHLGMLWQGFTHPSILKETAGRTNILLLGIGGGTHDGPDLTDTMVILSLPNGAGQPTLLSLPRDIWSETLQDKINSAYEQGKAKQIVTEVTGLPIHYTILIDFDGFTKLIDVLGGVDVTIPVGFVDHEYPIPGKENDPCNGDPLFRCRYQTITFLAGAEHFYGERALQYVRSRHAEGEEGSDFARAKRQQDIIQAVIGKLRSPQQYLSLSFVEKSAALFSQNVRTDISENELGAIIQKNMPFFHSFSPTHMSVENLLINPPEELYEGRYVLIPKGSWSAFQASIAAMLEDQSQK